MRALVISHSITRRDARSLEKYMTEVSRYDVLSPEQEVDLFRRFRAGEETAGAQLVNCNLKFVISVAKRYQHCGLSLGDLINEGNLGLIKAVHRFDETKGFKFISYAVWWIRQSILQAVGEKSREIRVPFNHQSNLMKVLRVRDNLLQRFEREPSVLEIADEAEMSEENVQKCLQSNRQTSSLDAPLEEGEDVSLANFIEDKDAESPDRKVVYIESLQKEMRMLLDTLTETEAAVITMFYGLENGQTYGLSEISDHLGLGKERVRQIKYSGLKKLSHQIKSKGLVFSMN